MKPNTTDWISAGSQASLGVIAALFGLYQWRHNGFRPRVSTSAESGQRRIAVIVRNAGRGTGYVQGVAVGQRDSDGLVTDGAYKSRLEGLGSRRHCPLTRLEAGAVMVLVFARPTNSKAAFPSDTNVQVNFGAGIKRFGRKGAVWKNPKEAKDGVFNFTSALPPSP